MDSSANINSDVINFKQYLIANKSLYADVLQKLEIISNKANNHLKSLLTKDNRIDNDLLEVYQFQTHGYAWFETYRFGLRETLNWFLN